MPIVRCAVVRRNDLSGWIAFSSSFRWFAAKNAATGPGQKARERVSIVGKKLYVGNLSFGISEAQLQELFSAHGTVASAQLIIDRDTGRSKGFGFV